MATRNFTVACIEFLVDSTGGEKAVRKRNGPVCPVGLLGHKKNPVSSKNKQSSIGEWFFIQDDKQPEIE